MKGEVVNVIFDEGTGKPIFAVVDSEAFPGLSITFTIKRGIWLEPERPRMYTKVFFNRVKLTDGGWRAFEARYWTKEDEMKKNEASMRRAS